MIQRLKQLRTQRGVSQQQLADIVGVSQQSINKYENHSVEPDICTLTALADYFNTSVDYLIGHSAVDHLIEEVQRCDLNGEELALLEGYRRLSGAEKESLRLIVENYNKNR